MLIKLEFTRWLQIKTTTYIIAYTKNLNLIKIYSSQITTLFIEND